MSGSQLKSIHDKLKKYKTRNETLFDLNLKLQLRLNRLESSESSASGNSNRLSRLEGFLEGRNYGLPDNTVCTKTGKLYFISTKAFFLLYRNSGKRQGW